MLRRPRTACAPLAIAFAVLAGGCAQILGIDLTPSLRGEDGGDARPSNGDGGAALADGAPNIGDDAAADVSVDGVACQGCACPQSCRQVFDQSAAFVVPEGCAALTASAWGAGGGRGYNNANGGGGGFTEGTFDVTPGQNLNVVVGTPGGSGLQVTVGQGGEPGGGAGGSATDGCGGGGGGLSGVFSGPPSYSTLILSAGGGGGAAGAGNVSGAGGGGAQGGLVTDPRSGRSGSQGNVGAGAGNGTAGTQGTGGTGGAGGTCGGGGGGAGFFGAGGGAGQSGSEACGSGGGGAGDVKSVVRNVRSATGYSVSGALTSDPRRGIAGDANIGGRVIVICN